MTLEQLLTMVAADMVLCRRHGSFVSSIELHVDDMGLLQGEWWKREDAYEVAGEALAQAIGKLDQEALTRDLL